MIAAIGPVGFAALVWGSILAVLGVLAYEIYALLGRSP